jgi:DNA ligase 1
MRRFAAAWERVDSTKKSSVKVAALAEYFASAPPADAAWALFVLSGRRLKRLLPSARLVEWTLARTGVPEWLFSESIAAVGDFAETCALLLEGGGGLEHDSAPGGPSLAEQCERIAALRGLAVDDQLAALGQLFSDLGTRERFLTAKIITGELRIGVAATLVYRAVAQAAALDVTLITQRMMGDFVPSAEFWARLVAAADAGGPGETTDWARPYPFCLAAPLEGAPDALGPREDWLVEWKWDGIRAQLVRRAGQVAIWSRGEELMTARFPELVAAAAALPDGSVLDGEILAMATAPEAMAGTGTERVILPHPFSVLQRRIGRQKLTPAVLAAAPVAFVAYDLLEDSGVDLRGAPLADRRARMERLLAGAPPALGTSPVVTAPTWAALAELRAGARERRVEGLMLKRLDSPYRGGRHKGVWWKWKIAPFTIDAVLIYAQPGSGRRASLLTDYTFAVWSGDELVPVAKAYSGLDDAEIAELDAWLRRHTRERFGPVRAVDPEQVFELGFEAIAPSPRHKSGIALRFPRMLRWRKDKLAREADTLEGVQAILAAANSVAGV